MIDATECFIFIESGHSAVASGNHITQKTLSPWIFHELSTAETIKEREPERLINLAKAASLDTLLNEARKLQISYPIPGTNLSGIDAQTLNYIESKASRHNALDLLYAI